MKTKEKAEELAKVMTQIGSLVGRETICIITPMEQPLGRNIGNSLEVIEAVEFLKGNMEDDVKEVVLELGSNMLKLAGKGESLQKNKELMLENIQNGKAIEKLRELIQNQNGDVQYIDDLQKFEKAKYEMPVILGKEGIIKSLKAEIVGKTSVVLGAGRLRKEDKIDYSVGICLEKKIGNRITPKEAVAYVYANDKEKGKEVVENLKKAYDVL